MFFVFTRIRNIIPFILPSPLHGCYAFLSALFGLVALAVQHDFSVAGFEVKIKKLIFFALEDMESHELICFGMKEYFLERIREWGVAGIPSFRKMLFYLGEDSTFSTIRKVE